MASVVIPQDIDGVHFNTAGEINAITLKASPVSADLLLIEDSAAAFAKKKITIGSLPGAAMTFLALTDVTEASYTGEGGNAVVVNVGETGLEFGTAAAGIAVEDGGATVVATATQLNFVAGALVADGGGGQADITPRSNVYQDLTLKDQTPLLNFVTGFTVTADASIAGVVDIAPTYGTGANTVCEGDDSRLSDARTPLAHAIGGALHTGELTDALHGTRGGGTQHADVIAAGASGFMTGADKTKLDGVEAGAQVTNTANVTAAGALMDSEVDADLKTLALPANTTISAFGATLVDDVDAPTARTTLGVDAAGTDNSTDVTLAGTPDYITITGQVITRNTIVATTDLSATGTKDATTFLRGDDTWDVPAGGGDVTAAANIGDNLLVRGDGAAKGVQNSGITVDDTDNLSGIGNITLTGTVDGRDVAADGSKLDGIETAAKDDQTITAGAGMTGGGLGDVTLDVIANGDGSITVNANDIQVGVLASDAQHGNRGNGSLHTVATGAAAGFMSAADKAKLDSLVTPLVMDPKQSVRAATTAAGTLATDFENGDTIDGVVLATSDRILVKNQSTASENGIYTVNASGAPSRASDMVATSSAAGVSVFVEEGTANADTGWLCTSDQPTDTVGTDPLSWAKFSESTVITSAAPADVTKAAASAGVSTEVARADHKHDVATAAPVDVSTSNAEGTSTSLARADHQHAHGVIGIGAWHAIATGAVAGFMSGPDKTKSDFITVTQAVDLDTMESDIATNNAKVSNVDHTGDVTTSGAPATVVALGTTGASVNVNLAAPPSTGDVLKATSATTATWQPEAGGVPTSRNLTAGAGLTGGGDLSADRTFDVVGNADGSITVNANDVQVGVLASDAQHGVRGGGTQHALAVAAGAAGFLSGADKTKLDNTSGTNTGDQTITLTGDVTGSGTGSFAATIANNAVTNAKAADMAANTIKANNTASLADPANVAVGTNTVVGRVGANIVAAQLTNSQVAASTLANAKLAVMAANTVKANATAGSTNPADLAVGTNTVLGRVAGNIVAAQVATGQVADDAITLAKMAAGTAGNLITYDAAGDPAAVATGTATHVLTSNGPGAAPTFQVAPGGTDADAIHDNVAGEIAAITAKATPVSGDFLIIEDSAAANVKKSITMGAIDHDALTNFVANEHIDWTQAGAGTIHVDNYIEGGPGTDTTAIHDNVAGEIAAITEKVTPVSADLLIIEDSAAANVKKRVQISNLPAGTPGADSITNTELANMAANTVKVRNAATLGDPVDMTVGASTVVGRGAAGDIVAAQLETSQVADNAITDAKAADMTGFSVKAKPTTGTGDPSNLTVGTNTVVGRVAGDVVAAQLVNGQIANATIGVAKLANGTDGELITWDAAGAAATVATGTIGQVLTSNGVGTAPTFQGAPAPVLTKAITVETPTATEDLTMFFTPIAITVTHIYANIIGGTTCTLQVYHNTNRDSAGNAVHSANVIAIVGAGTSITVSAGDPTIPANSWVWFETSGVIGSPTLLNVTVRYTED